MNDIREAALAYANNGHYILPLKPKGKTPLIKDWPNKASNNPEQIQEWWVQTPDANIGLLTGKKNGLFVIDVDGEYPAHFPPLDGAVNVKTGRGFHYYYKYPEGEEVPSRIKLEGEAVDVRSDNAYVVAPPSMHESGVRYEFE